MKIPTTSTIETARVFPTEDAAKSCIRGFDSTIPEHGAMFDIGGNRGNFTIEAVDDKGNVSYVS